MPRFLWILLTACSIQADYSGTHVRCSDGKCPSGMTCGSAGSEHAGYCGVPDASVGGSDAAVDARKAALTCADPGVALGSNDGNTTGSANHVSGMCGGLVYNGPDNVYAITGPRSVTINVSSSDFAVAAYVISTCTMNLPPCEGSAAAAPTLTLALGSGTHYLIVDGVNAGLSGRYHLDVH
ncbi:MAG: hypothetical protein JO257_12240 [Deltaproteobacteria bacterium]|nr:hypothetical protein [Deltaproteobacteria bacterium]